MFSLTKGVVLGALTLATVPAVAAAEAARATMPGDARAATAPGDRPAPIRLAQAGGHAGAQTIRVGTLLIERPWLRATPTGAKVAGGYLRVTNDGPAPDRLVGASIPLAPRGEVHEMAVADGIMKMREVDGGLEIPPGATVELKPGGFHLMFLDLTAGPKLGEPVRGTLTFQKAGTVEVTFDVAPIGAPGPASHH